MEIQANPTFSWYCKVYAHKYTNQLRDTCKHLFSGKGIPPSHSDKLRVVKEYYSKYTPTVFVETGTYLGHMIHSVHSWFSQTHSIELDPVFYTRAVNKFAKHPSVTIHLGDSTTTLPKVIESIETPILFWLDAHYFGGVTALGMEETPILKELSAIFNHPIKNHYILIDDARCFTGENGYPTPKDLTDFVSKYRPDLLCDIRHDVIRIIPK
jgi:hypothetical protein